MSSKLLINEPPLQVLPSLALRCGLNEAIILQQVHYWLGMKQIGKEVAGRKWVRNSIREWKEQNFPFWHENTVARAVSSLVKQGALLQRQDLSDNLLDRSMWYSIDYNWLDASHQDGGMGGTNLVESSIYTESTTDNVATPPVALPPPAKTKKAKKTAFVNEETGVSTSDILKEYENLLSTLEPRAVIAYEKEAAAALALAKAGWHPAQVAATTRYLKEDKFYGKNHLSLWTVAKQIAAYHAHQNLHPAFVPQTQLSFSVGDLL